MMNVLMSGYYGGRKESGIFYQMFNSEMYDGTYVYGIIRNYGERDDGSPWMDVSLVCVDDGTVDSYRKVYDLFRKYVDAD